jgi:hypothetical protein
VLGFNTEPLVSSDFNHTTVSSTFDATLTKVTGGNMVKVLAWYDNEWGFSNRMLETARAMFEARYRPDRAVCWKGRRIIAVRLPHAMTDPLALRSSLAPGQPPPGDTPARVTASKLPPAVQAILL